MDHPWTPYQRGSLGIGLTSTAARQAVSALVEVVQCRAFMRAATLLGLAVGALVVAHIAWWSGGADPASPLRFFAIDLDYGVSESFEYVLSFTASVLMLLCFRLTGQMTYASLAGVHAWLMLDNSARAHERLGGALELFLVEHGGPALGESLVFATVVAVIGALVGLTLSRAPVRHRGLGLALAGVAGSMVLFAGVVDVAHGWYPSGPPLVEAALILLEDGGELTVFTLNAALAFAVWAQLRPRAPAFARSGRSGGLERT